MNVSLTSEEEQYIDGQKIEELRSEIEKSWDSELSKRSVSDIIASKNKKV